LPPAPAPAPPDAPEPEAPPDPPLDGAAGEAPVELVPGTVPVTGLIGCDAAGDIAGEGWVIGASFAVVPMVSLQAARPISKAAPATNRRLRETIIWRSSVKGASGESLIAAAARRVIELHLSVRDHVSTR
jgi:hypothetical protein